MIGLIIDVAPWWNTVFDAFEDTEVSLPIAVCHHVTSKWKAC